MSLRTRPHGAAQQDLVLKDILRMSSQERFMRSTRDISALLPPSVAAPAPGPSRVSSPSWERGFGRVLSSASIRFVAFDDMCTAMKAVSSSLGGPHGPGTPGGGSSSRGKSARSSLFCFSHGCYQLDE